MLNDLGAPGLAVVIIAAIICIAFFLPWANVESQEVGQLSKLLTGKAQSNIASISGFSVPGMANSPDSRLAISVIKMFDPNVKDADKKSFLLWVVPLLAIALAAAMYAAGSNKMVNIVVATMGIGVFALGFYKVNTTDLNKLILNIRIGIGLWLVLWGYLGIGIAAIVNFIKLNKAA